ncbi:MAG: transcription-repair coupling factor [Alphaproteobacteria bacterium]
MESLDTLFESPRRLVIAGAPQGYDALVLARAARATKRPILHIAEDEARMAQIAQALAFFAPEIEVLTLPAWDCLPYDRVSPNGEVVARRIETLTRLAGMERVPSAPRIVVTTVSAALQRVPPRETFLGAVFDVAKGTPLPLDALMEYLSRNGYHRAETVREPGEYAVRGGLIDLFPPGCDEPLRIDLFGDEIEAIRAFDPVTQRSIRPLEGFRLKPVSEVLLEAAAIERFRSGYRDLFGAVTGDDPLYEAISEGRRFAGLEHWLPLFFERLESVFDYVPDAAVTLDQHAEEARDARLDTIADYYAARAAMGGRGGPGGGRGGDLEHPYKPLPPDRLYLNREEWDRHLGSRAVGVFSPFRAPEHAADTLDAEGRGGRDFAEVRARPGANVFDELRGVILEQEAARKRVVLACYSAGARERMAGMLHDHGITEVAPCDHWSDAAALPFSTTALAVLAIERGFTAPGALVITEQDILGDRLARPPRRRRRAEEFIAEASALGEGDLVVHVDHGIGRYESLVTLEVGGAPHDCLKLLYDGGDKLFVPVENIEVLSRYGSADVPVALDKLGGAGWQARKARVRKRILDIAEKLLQVAAQRQLREAPRLTPAEGLYDEFCARFPYPETEDQIRAIDDTVADLATGRPMDRLICGDVGFGKTEVALRAAFVAVMAGVQVAVVVPTTLLSRQHLATFRARFAGLPVRIEQLSRLTSPKDAAAVRRALADGSVDIVIGTHALLAKSIVFRNLGLLVVDEEQHFGVVQKERLKQLRADVHVLTLTATPIPRTLQMALSGVKEMSVIATPPVDRLAVRTFVLPFDPVVVREAILREHYRGGQSFYVCPRIEDLNKVAERLRALVPEVRVAVAHGRLAARALEGVMTAFYEGAYEVLVCTNIVESGLDIPTANTMIVHRSDMFGLAQLYQLRGRIGRAKVRAYAYLTLPPGKTLTPVAQRRLEILHTLDSLGAGFTLASYDLDLRGAGNLLGDEQSGHIREVGIELYQHMLEEAVAQAKGAPREEAAEWVPQIAIGTPVLIPESFVPDLGLRLSLYRRIAGLRDAQEIEAFAVEMIDRFGPLPDEVNNLLDVVAIKRACIEANVERVEAGPKGALLSFRDNRFPNPAGLIEFMTREKGAVKLRPDHRLVYSSRWETPPERISGLRALLQRIGEIAAASGARRDKVEGLA